MKKNTALESLLRKLSKLDAQIKKAVNDPCWWRPGYSKKINDLYDKVDALGEEFAAIGYILTPVTREVKKMA